MPSFPLGVACKGFDTMIRPHGSGLKSKAGAVAGKLMGKSADMTQK